ncbi:hypothetical protein GGS21DRAFT_134885 [Xylaria nigripes]|nr:hypothetical protein GGS21DRAFT_134885 [Xylaria nigripes]
MAVEIVTIVNSSGKVISNGKQIVNVLKEAKAAYDEKKAAVKAERAIRRSQTYASPAASRYDAKPKYDEYSRGDYHRRAHHDDAVSYASSRRSHSSKHDRSSRHRAASDAGSALTESNLRAHSEVNSLTRARPPVAHGSPCPETASRDMLVSRPKIAHASTMPTPAKAPVHPPTNELALVDKAQKDIDMDLAYGSIPPDLADRVDLDPTPDNNTPVEQEQTARTLIEKIEDLLNEAQCLHHTATHIIEHLQKQPEAAAAVALALAELSSLLGKISPSFLAILKGGSPAIFGLLISPQFLIAAGLTVGVTVVMFGGWKIVKRIQNAKEAEAAARTAPMTFEAHPEQAAQPPHQQYAESEVSEGIDEALVVEEELSAIETWRRGITPFGEDGSAEIELISPKAHRAVRRQHGGDDARSERSARTSRTHRSSKSSKEHHSHRSRADNDDKSVRERRSSRPHDDNGDQVSESGSHRSHRNHHGHHSHQSHHSSRSEKTEHSSKSRRSSKIEVKSSEEGRQDRESATEAVSKPKKDSMIKSLFKMKKRKEDEGERSSSERRSR